MNYFQKGVLLGQKAALNLWYVNTRPNSQKLSQAFEGLSYLAYKIQKTTSLVIFFIQIIHIALFRGDFLPFYSFCEFGLSQQFHTP